MIAHWKTTPEEANQLEWFADKVCICEDGSEPCGYAEYKERHDLRDKPILCRRCGKWYNYVYPCVQCGELFYHWFTHHHSGVHPATKWRAMGVMCWNCLEEFLPGQVESSGYTKSQPVPPPKSVLPPGVVLYDRATDERLIRATAAARASGLLF